MINLLDLVIERDLEKEITILNNKVFGCFARLTSETNENKCVFVSNKKYLDQLDDSVSMIITDQTIASQIDTSQYGVAISENPRGLFFELLSRYEAKKSEKQRPTVIGDNCKISKKALIPQEGVVIGNNVTIDDYVVVHPHTTIGDNVVIQTGCMIAEQDLNTYEYKGKTKRVFHSGRVIIHDNSILCPGVFIGQALYSYGVTQIGKNTTIGTHTAIGHNSIIGECCEICGNSIIGGFCTIGDKTTLYLSTTVANNITIGSDVKVNIGSVVVRNIPDGRTVFGNPAREIG